ncbi:DNA glycosylase AlkZ-like family protein [Candidatus Latescibacterota bacterium]
MNPETIRHYQLNKQHLIYADDHDDYAAVLKGHIALHSTDYVTPYLSLWARTGNFDPSALFDDLSVNRRALRLRAFRGTVFVAHSESLADILGSGEYYQATRLAEIKRFKAGKYIDFSALEQDVIELLSGDKQMNAREMRQAVGGDMKGDVFSILLRLMEFKGILARAGQRYITDKVIRYGLMREWVPDIDYDAIDPHESLKNLMRRYIRQFGPVCLDDICWWFPLKKATAREILEHIRDELRTFDFNNRSYIMEKNDFNELNAFKPPSGGEPVVSFLPYEDHFPKAYYVRDWYISAETTPSVFHVGKLDYGQIRPSVWIEGEVIGRWEMEWTDTKKTSMKVDIIDLIHERSREREVSGLIEKRRMALEEFINNQLVPLLKGNS